MAAVSAATAASTASAALPSVPKVCFNSNCRESLEKVQKGWRRRTGEFAELCDRCASAYDDGKFCETFHLNASGWRCCESCGKQIHCGCIVSFHMFVLLDAGGIECITCARKSFILTPNPAWPPPLFLPLQPERIKDLSAKNWSPLAGSGPIPWRQAPSLFNGSSVQSEIQPRTPVAIEFDVSGGLDRLRLNDKISSTFSDKRKEESFERLVNGSLRIGASEITGGGDSGTISLEQPAFSQNAFKRPGFAGISDFSFISPPTASNGKNDLCKGPGTSIHRPTQSPVMEKTPSIQNSTVISEPPVRSGRAKLEFRARSQLLPRYWPRISNEELQQISGDSNSVITPLFEKMLSASDAGRIGRLVLPKKCAEAYFPPISSPDGVPLEVQDLKGKDWIFQFRFWPNNNSRMYVLEGITPCIQSMQLQAGDIVTFSRIEPEGKLVMGCRKVSSAASDQENGGVHAASEHSADGDIKSSELASSKSHVDTSSGFRMPNPAPAKSGSTLSEMAMPGPIPGEVSEPKLQVHKKRKNCTLGLKSKRLRIENEDMLELKVTWEQVQGLFRPPPNKTPNLLNVDGCEIEEFEDAPVIGRPTIPATDHLGRNVQWVQCEDCCKWRKVPAGALLQSKWTCSTNLWDPERSSCSALEELSSEKLEVLLNVRTAASVKMKAPKQDPESVKALEGLDALANLAVQEKLGPARAPKTTKHPRHGPGCSCIVCIQPPRGKGRKHPPRCTCIVCKSTQRRFNTLMLKREKKQVENDSDTGHEMPQHDQPPEGVSTGNASVVKSGKAKNSVEVVCVSDEDRPDNFEERSSSVSQYKGEIDLNIQPEKEEEVSPRFYSGSESGLQIETKEQLKHRLYGAGSEGNLVGK
ncbi:OLC1v1021710C1 [Oldenlandia corymbosa var. corymbosa]|uniref:OLC1v1021710C1 n=1 Tax=Oldenlandia corymbosa var. corymbosa TaxID=529605 RepID=A0AAV1BZW7_OLDCO|nr:OLC1v1021710C1 [Oldenlandia corymbosa var. corymbosa]